MNSSISNLFEYTTPTIHTYRNRTVFQHFIHENFSSRICNKINQPLLEADVCLGFGSDEILRPRSVGLLLLFLLGLLLGGLFAPLVVGLLAT
jgi:hypothetical protein